MRNLALLMMILVLASCSAATANEINTSDDLHCSIIVQTVEMNADSAGATLIAKKGLYAMRTWYYSRIIQSRLGETAAVVETLKRNRPKLAQYAQECAQRAFREPEFNRWSKIAAKDYDQSTRR